jgi:heat-inducible transcriptional repressor
MRSKKLIERKAKILKAIIQNYTVTAKPVGSEIVASKLNLKISSATVRNIMVELESFGYIWQPYTSAGRVPTDLGYRRYVEELEYRDEISFTDAQQILKGLDLEDKVFFCLKEDVFEKIPFLLSRILNYPSFLVCPFFELSRFKKLNFLVLDQRRLMVVITTTTDLIKEKILYSRHHLSIPTIRFVVDFINDKLKNTVLQKIPDQLEELVTSESDQKLKDIVEMIKPVFSCKDNLDIHLKGFQNIFKYPELCSPKNLIKIFEVFERKDLFSALLDQHRLDKDDVQVRIGRENIIDHLKDCSVVTITCRCKDIDAGILGIIGPKRMDYYRVFSVLNYFSKFLDKTLSNII